MILLFRDTDMGYGEISSMMEKYFGPAGPDTWMNTKHYIDMVPYGAIEIYSQDEEAVMMVWFLWK